MKGDRDCWVGPSKQMARNWSGRCIDPDGQGSVFKYESPYKETNDSDKAIGGMFRSTRCKEGGSAECGDFCMVFSEQMGATEILVCGLFLRPAFRNKLRYWTGRRNETFSQSCYAQAFPRIGGIRQSRQPFQYKPAYL
jgi:hypothetical protein